MEATEKMSANLTMPPFSPTMGIVIPEKNFQSGNTVGNLSVPEDEIPKTDVNVPEEKLQEISGRLDVIKEKVEEKAEKVKETQVSPCMDIKVPNANFNVPDPAKEPPEEVFLPITDFVPPNLFLPEIILAPFLLQIPGLNVKLLKINDSFRRCMLGGMVTITRFPLPTFSLPSLMIPVLGLPLLPNFPLLILMSIANIIALMTQMIAAILQMTSVIVSNFDVSTDFLRDLEGQIGNLSDLVLEKLESAKCDVSNSYALSKISQDCNQEDVEKKNKELNSQISNMEKGLENYNESMPVLIKDAEISATKNQAFTIKTLCGIVTEIEENAESLERKKNEPALDDPAQAIDKLNGIQNEVEKRYGSTLAQLNNAENESDEDFKTILKTLDAIEYNKSVQEQISKGLSSSEEGKNFANKTVYKDVFDDVSKNISKYRDSQGRIIDSSSSALNSREKELNILKMRMKNLNESHAGNTSENNKKLQYKSVSKEALQRKVTNLYKMSKIEISSSWLMLGEFCGLPEDDKPNENQTDFVSLLPKEKDLMKFKELIQRLYEYVKNHIADLKNQMDNIYKTILADVSNMSKEVYKGSWTGAQRVLELENRLNSINAAEFITEMMIKAKAVAHAHTSALNSHINKVAEFAKPLHDLA